MVSGGGLAGDLFHVNQHIDAPRATKSHSWQGKSYTVGIGSVDVESVATQSLIDSESIPRTMNSSRASSHSQHLSGMGELGSESTLGELSPSHSLVITSSPWLKSSTSKNLDLSNDGSKDKVEEVRMVIPTILLESDELHDPVTSEKDTCTSVEDSGNLRGTQRFDTIIETPTEMKSSLGETLDRVGLLVNHDCLQGPPTRPPGVSARSVTLSLFDRSVETRCTHYTHSSSALTDGAGVPGSHIAPSTIYRHSVYSPLTLDVENEESCEVSSGEGGTVTHARFEGWPNEVALAYTLSMADVAIYGRTSVIQSAALEGVCSRDRDTRGLGLKQLAKFSLTEHAPSGKSDFMAWTIRHGAVLGLSRVCHTCKQLAMKDGLSSVAWSTLMNGHSTEKDTRVLEAFRMSQICPDVDGPLLAVDSGTLSSPLLGYMADALARLFLPPVTSTSSNIFSKSPPKRLRPTAARNNPPRQAMAK
jgi:hypothetical protein